MRDRWDRWDRWDHNLPGPTKSSKLTSSPGCQAGRRTAATGPAVTWPTWTSPAPLYPARTPPTSRTRRSRSGDGTGSLSTFSGVLLVRNPRREQWRLRQSLVSSSPSCWPTPGMKVKLQSSLLLFGLIRIISSSTSFKNLHSVHRGVWNYQWDISSIRDLIKYTENKVSSSSILFSNYFLFPKNTGNSNQSKSI